MRSGKKLQTARAKSQISKALLKPAAAGVLDPREVSEMHGRRSRGDRGDLQGGQVPQNLERGDANANCPPIFCHIGTKVSVLWPSKYAKIRFRPGICPGPRWGSSRRSPDYLVGWREDTPPYFNPLGTDPPSALAMRPPRSPTRSTPMRRWPEWTAVTVEQ